MPPLSLASSKRIFTAFDDETPYVAAGPERSVCMPSTISLPDTPRVACPIAGPATATAPTRILAIQSFFIDGSFLPLGVHGVDRILVFLVHVRPLQLHRRRQLL